MKFENVSGLSDEEFKRLVGIKQRNQDLSEDSKSFNTKLSKVRVACENVFGMLKRFKIISEKFRNARDTFEFKFSLIAKLYNYELAK